MTRPAVSAPPGPADAAQRLWDLPTRAFHWLIVALVGFSWWSATHDHLPWHRLSGYAVLGLLVFRLIWGFAGAATARFASFVRGPRAVRAWLRGEAPPLAGHNPLGGWSVVAMLGVLAVQVGLGLFSIDEDGFEAGPLAKWISFSAARAVARLHHLNFWLLAGLIALHLIAIAVHAARGRPLVPAMITGRAVLPPGAPAPLFVPAWRFFAAAALAAAVATLVARGL